MFVQSFILGFIKLPYNLETQTNINFILNVFFFPVKKAFREEQLGGSS